MVQEQARKIAEKLGNTTFKASNGWLHSFKRRHNIVWNSVCGESNDVDMDIVNNWQQRISQMISNYEPQNIYNADETGLFFRAIPSKTLALKGNACKGGKCSKERLTLFVCANLRGEFEKLLIIGKSAKPRCFKNLSLSDLPVIWRNNTKAWNTASIMEDWLQHFNEKMKNENRKVILFLDNATCHPKLQLSNVELAWFPPNTTSITQPLDQGVIYCIKLHYRKLLMQSLLASVETQDNLTGIVKSISVLDAINWITMALKNVEKVTVIKCFRKAGFLFHHQEISDTEIDLGSKEEELNTTLNIRNEDLREFIAVDDNLLTCDDFDVIVETEQHVIESAAEEEPIDQEVEENAITSYRDACKYLKFLENFALNKGDSNFLEMINSCKYHAENKILSSKMKQKSIVEFLSV